MKIWRWSVEIRARSSGRKPGRWELQPWWWLAELSLSKVGKGTLKTGVTQPGEKLHLIGEENEGHGDRVVETFLPFWLHASPHHV